MLEHVSVILDKIFRKFSKRYDNEMKALDRLAGKQNHPVGTILGALNKKHAEMHFAGEWVRADGRSIKGSALAKAMRSSIVIDLGEHPAASKGFKFFVRIN